MQTYRSKFAFNFCEHTNATLSSESMADLVSHFDSDSTSIEMLNMLAAFRAYIFFACCLFGSLWCHSFSEQDAVEALSIVMQKASSQPNYSLSPDLTGARAPLSFLARMSISIVALIGTVHIPYVALQFSNLGYSLPVLPASREDIYVDGEDDRPRAISSSVEVQWVSLLKVNTEC